MEKIKKTFFKSSNSNKGITLVALVITIVILIILATVSIRAVFGEDGLIKQAQEAKNYQTNAEVEQNKFLGDAETTINDALSGKGGSESGESGEQTVPETVEDAKKDETKLDETTTIKDGLDNSVVIPGGFHVDKDSGNNVEDGIVIEDDIGNQFVWIPVGTYHTTNGDKTNNLSRRTFTSSGATEVTGDDGIASDSYYFYGEGDFRSIAASTIGAFKTNATTKGGFYIGRYEQGTGNVCKAGVEPYVNVTRDTANTQAKAMYNGNSYVTSELISSYAWDTALNFVCQTNSAGYTLATTTDDVYGNIGTSTPTTTGEYEADKYSNICDFLGNRREWTTECYSYGGTPAVYRGAYYNFSNIYTSYRCFTLPSASSDDLGFRTQLYVM